MRNHLRSLIVAAASILGCGALASAQGNPTTPVNATAVQIAGQNVTGFLYLTPVDANGRPISLVTADNKLQVTPVYSGALTAGALAAPLNIPDQCTATPTTPNTRYDLQVQIVSTSPKGSTGYTIPGTTSLFCGSSTVALESYRPTQAGTALAGTVFGTVLPSSMKCSQPGDRYITYSGTTITAVYECLNKTLRQVPTSGGTSLPSGTGLLKTANGVPSVATPGVDYLVPGSSNRIDATAAPYFASPYGATTTTTTASAASGATLVSVASCTGFSAGNGVLVTGGGTTGWTGTDYIGRISGCVANILTLQTSLTASVASGAVVKHDDSAALNAISAACTTSSYHVVFPAVPGSSEGLYRFNGPFLDTAQSNAIWVLPNPALVGGTGNVCSLEGNVRVESGFNGITIQSDYTGNSSANIVGGKKNGAAYGGFTNTYLALKDLRILAAGTSPNITVVDATWMKGYTQEGHVWVGGSAAWGIKYPTISNDVDIASDTVTCVGNMANCVRLGEHARIGSIHGDGLPCLAVFDSVTTNSGVTGHANGIYASYIWGQLLGAPICGGSTPQTIHVSLVDAEVAQKICVDPNNMLSGDVTYHVPYNDSRTAQTITGPPLVTGCSNLRLHNLDTGVCYGATCPSSNSGSTATLSTGLAARWKMQDGSGSSSANSVDSTKPLTNTAVTYGSSTGYTNTVATFNGTSSYARAATTALYQVTGAAAFSFCTWHTPSTMADGDRWFAGTFDIGGFNGWGLEDGYASGNITFYLAIDSSHYLSAAFASSMVAGTRYNVCVNYDGSKTAAGVTLTVNGQNMAGKTITGDTFGSGTITNNTGYFTLGARGDSTATGFWGGAIGDTAIWNRVLTTGEMLALYNAGPSGW